MKEAVVNIESYILPATLSGLDGHRKLSPRRVKIAERFLGPIPEWWAAKANICRNPGAVFVGLLLWREYHFANKRQPVRLTKATLQKVQMSRRRVNGALAALEKAGLVALQKFAYRSPLITIVTGQQHSHVARGP